MRKIKFFIDYNKEENWLNSMAQLGYELEDVCFGYKFHKGKPEKSNIKIDYRTFKSKEEFWNYCALFEDCGWKHIAGSKYSGTQYFKKVNESGTEDIFSDISSKAGRYKRLANMWLTFSAALFPLFIVNISTNAINLKALLNPKLSYLTPGLWEMKGLRFWTAFLFETPFAFMRLFSWGLFLLMFLIYLGVAFKAYILYRQSKIEN